jgi:hypothetical protein
MVREESAKALSGVWAAAALPSIIGGPKNFNGVFGIGPAMGLSYCLVGGLGFAHRLWSELGEDRA